ncbi:hypothetical protein BC939DRAFT_89703 [Gamsiella multidivaricata]|uniref:uncharacterized protein n=1 Tax=Gamsiella multidivaricata TaxID=101098 RepID=UPI00221FBBA8|nr:uncharacterized protein BC939DRAFT_89703 [Gamsiella multidivaricata]KAG0359047.1 hypothetical protein BGZ54_010153 [Gamsiella multidivaricata]KAI7827427.1 hypothetical protein BC939DRAFT_89703 [Gamsiella multidivaricata]
MAHLWDALHAKTKVLTLATPPGPTSTAVNTTTPAVFIIPEVLERVLSFLNPYKRRTIARFVCKQWLAICRDIQLPIPLFWSISISATNYQRVLERLSTVRALSAAPRRNNSYTEMKLYPSKKEALRIWQVFLCQLESCLGEQDRTVSSKGSDKGDQHQSVGLRRLHPLESLELSYDFTEVAYLAPLLPLLPRFSILKTIRLKTMARPDRILLFPILEACPNLEELYALTNYFWPYRVNVDVMRDRERIHPFKPVCIHSRMKILVLQHMLLTPETIESMVVACPNLTELRIFQGIPMPPLYEEHGSVESTRLLPRFNRSVFLKLVAATCFQLRCFHLSITGERLSDEELGLLLNHPSPVLNEWSFSDQEIEISQMDRLNAEQLQSSLSHRPHPDGALGALLRSDDPLVRAHHNRLTRLELTKTPRLNSRDGISAIQSGGVLHQFLCQAPLLQHLIATNVVIEIEKLDVNRVLEKERLCGAPKDTGQNRRQERQAIWACRGLKTLHTTFDNDWDIAYKSGWAHLEVNSLIVFGYLSKCCPRLRDVHIRRWSSNMSYNSGFCFLSRLQDLERLVLTAKTLSNLESKELAWMRHRYTSNGSYSYVQSPLSLSPSEIPAYRNADDKEVDLSKLGLLADVKKWAKESEQSPLWGTSKEVVTGSGGCWPHLEYFKLTCANVTRGFELKHFLKEIWPNVEFIFKESNFYNYEH